MSPPHQIHDCTPETPGYLATSDHMQSPLHPNDLEMSVHGHMAAGHAAIQNAITKSNSAFTC